MFRFGLPRPTTPVVGRCLLALALASGAFACSSDDTTSSATTTSTTLPSPDESTPTTQLDLTTTTFPGRVSVGVGSTPLGQILVDADGRTLYAFASDAPNTSNCTGTCAEAWPPLLASSIVTTAGLEAATFTLIGRPDGAAGATSGQVAADGRPLYLFTGDSRAGETIGQGFNGSWFAVRPDGSLVQSETATITTSTAPED